MADTDYSYEAVVMEGLNDGLGTKPSAIQPTGVEDTLTVRLCPHQGSWDAGTSYNQEDVVDYNGLSYKLAFGTGRVSAITPDLDPLWELHDKRIVYIQFPSTLCVSNPYTQLPLPDKPSYGFFELQVTELSNPVYTNTWKPVRGLIEFMFSPTARI